ncbi:DNA internalization-related competence protein ComEC/Rec2 [Paenibacillus sinopodophylli]|uniref:DNA internalization-related competence protein ComEC/Rec2 n=1 Tax=Paenibacillus sinopodophylli TaxID=1837342 RepID=UPI00110D01FB|nr:DNA internalization-related competence protein ComEC/Rec2 [Paenibacillus sinopodophylli]
MNRRPLLWFAICYVAGSAAAAGLDSRGVLLAAGAAALLALAAVLCRLASWQLAAACALAVGLAAGHRLWADARNVTELPALLAAAEADGPRAAYAAEAEGVIVSAVEVDGDRVIFRVAASRIRVGGDGAALAVRERLIVHVRLAEQPEQLAAAAWQRGDLVHLAGELTRPAVATNRGGFDYRRYLSSQRIHWLLKVQGTAAVEAAPGPTWTAAAMLGRVDSARDYLGERMDAQYPSSQSGYMKGLVLGIREDLDPEQFQQFSRLGLTHILAISGLHVAVFLYAMGGLLRFARVSRERILLVLMLAVPMYVLLAGASPSVVRAGLMSVLGLLAARMGKLKDGMHLLAAAAVLMLVYDPFFIENVSFQLSFIVTIGLIIGVQPVRQALPQWRRGKSLLDLFAVTVVAQIVSFPVSIYYFNQFHLLSVVANFILVPFISFIVMPLGAAALLLAIPWEQGGLLLAYASHYANDWTFAFVDRLARIDALRTIWATPPLWWVATWLFLLGITFRLIGRGSELRRAGEAADNTADQEMTMPLAVDTTYQLVLHTGRRSSMRLYGLLLLMSLLLFYAYKPQWFNSRGEVSFIDVGQGDAIHIRTPSGKHMLIDGGGTLSFRKPGEEWRERSDPFEVGRKVLVPLLMKRGVQEIDLLVISHLDSDHIRGLKAVLESIPVRSIWWNGTIKEADDARELLKLGISLNIPMYRVQAGIQHQLDAATKLKVLWPPALGNTNESIKHQEEQNESSVVMTVKLYQSIFVFSGDINSVTERGIIRNEQSSGSLEEKQAPAAILKVAHHGSRFSTSEEWLSYWRPIGAVASVGASNTYGHPNPEVLAKLAKWRTKVWRTDVDGEVGFHVSETGLFVSD